MGLRDLPFVTMILAVAYFISPFGSDLFHLAFSTSSDMALPVLLIVIAMVIVLGGVEMAAKIHARKKRGKEASNG